jgi:hypothetical protein
VINRAASRLHRRRRSQVTHALGYGYAIYEPGEQTSLTTGKAALDPLLRGLPRRRPRDTPRTLAYDTTRGHRGTNLGLERRVFRGLVLAGLGSGWVGMV